MTTRLLDAAKLEQIASPPALERGWELRVKDNDTHYLLQFAAPLLDGYCYICHTQWEGPIPWNQPDAWCHESCGGVESTWAVSPPLAIPAAIPYLDAWKHVSQALQAFDEQCEEAAAEATRDAQEIIQGLHARSLHQIQKHCFGLGGTGDEHTPGSYLERGLNGYRLVTWTWAPHPGWHTTTWQRLTITTEPIYNPEEP